MDEAQAQALSPPSNLPPPPNDPEDHLSNAPHPDSQTVPVPPWFHGAVQEVRNEMMAEIRGLLLPPLFQLMNLRRLDGFAEPFKVVPFKNGDDPTEDPHNLPALQNVHDIEHIQDPSLFRYLDGYGVARPFPQVVGNAAATRKLRRGILKDHVGCSR